MLSLPCFQYLAYILREHNIPKKICTSLDEIELPVKLSTEEGKAVLASVFKSVSAFYERKNQFQEVVSQVRTHAII
jgi:hypothetical protein